MQWGPEMEITLTCLRPPQKEVRMRGSKAGQSQGQASGGATGNAWLPGAGGGEESGWRALGQVG